MVTQKTVAEKVVSKRINLTKKDKNCFTNNGLALQCVTCVTLFKCDRVNSYTHFVLFRCNLSISG